MHAVALIVETDERERRLLREHLGKFHRGWRIEVAAAMDTALQIVQHRYSETKEPVDLLIVNVALESEDDGLVMARGAQEIDGTIKVIAYLTTRGGPSRYYDIYRSLNPFSVIEKDDERVAFRTEIALTAGRAMHLRYTEKDATFFRRYFDRKLYEHLIKDPHALDLQRRIVTVAFWDIRGFSTLCEALPDASQVIGNFLKEYFDCAAKVIYEHGGILDKFIGDGVMALFGPFDSDDSARRASACCACDAAIRLRTEFRSLALDWHRQFEEHASRDLERIDQTFGLGCGINTGAVVIGRIATSARDDFTAIGPDVNLAARVEASANRDQILLGQKTKARVAEVFDVGDRTIKDLKGVGEVVVYELIGKKATTAGCL